MRRLAIVSPSEPLAIMFEHGGNPYYRVLFEDLRALGHVEGQTLAVDRFSREKAAADVPAMLSDVVRSAPDVIYAIGAGPLVKAATTTIPVVALTGDPISLGLAQSLARPGGNFTGVAVDTGPSLHGKRIELMREVWPKLSRLAYVTARRDSFGQTIVEAVAKSGLPAIYTFPESVAAGGLLAYSFDLKELNHRAARDIDAILRGANPAEIPFYQVTRLILSINLKTAKALGLTIPPAILARADEVIE